jgi:hypothetical protein
LTVMILSRARKLVLLLHVTSSIGWLGAVVSFLALAIIGLDGTEAQKTQAAYLAMNAIGWSVIVPLALAALMTGIVQSIGTEWGLFRHYWVLLKLVFTTGATILLVVHMQPTGRVAAEAAQRVLSATDLRSLRVQLVLDAAGAIVVLLVVTALSVYKPWGMTAYGWRRAQSQNRTESPAARRFRRKAAPWGRYVLLCLALLVLVVLFVHLRGGGMAHH